MISPTACEHDWDYQAICRKCRTSYHTHMYWQVKKKDIELMEANKRIAQLEALLAGEKWGKTK